MILYSRTGRSAEARTLFDQIRQGHDGYLTTASLTEAQLAINLAEHEFGRALTTLDKLIGLFKETGHSETYFYELFQTRAETYAETGNYEAAYKSQKHYLDLYRKKVGDDNERNLGRIRHAARRQPSRRRKGGAAAADAEVRLAPHAAGHRGAERHPAADGSLPPLHGAHEPPSGARQTGRGRRAAG